MSWLLIRCSFGERNPQDRRRSRFDRSHEGIDRLFHDLALIDPHDGPLARMFMNAAAIADT